jgi:hypothetical protein
MTAPTGERIAADWLFRAAFLAAILGLAGMDIVAAAERA